MKEYKYVIASNKQRVRARVSFQHCLPLQVFPKSDQRSVRSTDDSHKSFVTRQHFDLTLMCVFDPASSEVFGGVPPLGVISEQIRALGGFDHMYGESFRDRCSHHSFSSSMAIVSKAEAPSRNTLRVVFNILKFNHNFHAYQNASAVKTLAANLFLHNNQGSIISKTNPDLSNSSASPRSIPQRDLFLFPRRTIRSNKSFEVRC